MHNAERRTGVLRGIVVGRFAVCVVALCCVVGCGGADIATNGPTTTNASASAHATSNATPGATGSATPIPTVVSAGDADDGHAITLQTGQLLHVSLSSTYWTLADSSDPNVLRERGTPVVSPQPSGCVPGAGCGTASAVYVAVAAGTAHVSASRTSCGEAMGCTGSSGSWSLTVDVR